MKTAKIPLGHDGDPLVTSEMKAVCIGEFKETYSISCPDCDGDDECELCDATGEYQESVYVSWTTMKQIYKMMAKEAMKEIET